MVLLTFTGRSRPREILTRGDGHLSLSSLCRVGARHDVRRLTSMTTHDVAAGRRVVGRTRCYILLALATSVDDHALRRRVLPVTIHLHIIMMMMMIIIITFIIIITRPHRSTTYVDAAYCYLLSSVVCLSVTLVNPTKTAALIEMPFGLRTQMGPRNRVLDVGPDCPWEGAILRWKGVSYCKV